MLSGQILSFLPFLSRSRGSSLYISRLTDLNVQYESCERCIIRSWWTLKAIHDPVVTTVGEMVVVLGHKRSHSTSQFRLVIDSRWQLMLKPTVTLA
ncbi:hypothetical protein F5880DRAFT_1247608 [Lentinula raphanica]|nr:hypothetical protein F5880DRAFT_1247608 [Lentinula raphanica]